MTELCPDCGRPVGISRGQCAVQIMGARKSDHEECAVVTLKSLRAQLLAAEDSARLSRDCGQVDVCAVPPGCQRHWQERNRELVTERDDVEVTLADSVAREKLANLRADEARALLQRMVKYIREDNAATPGTTRLARLTGQVIDYMQRTHDPNSILREKP